MTVSDFVISLVADIANMNIFQFITLSRWSALFG
jgi:hypothetical protein